MPHAGWMVVSGKEFADHLWSARFVALIIVLGLAALIPMYFAADTIRAAASQVTGTSSIFLYLFTLAPKVGDAQVQLPSAWEFVAIVGPLLGIVFAFDAVNGERADRHPAAAPVAADLPRRRDQRQVRGGAVGHRPRADDRRRC